jgi:Secretion system C-terminal sorting domain
MKQMLLAALTALCFHANAQTTITDSYFPTEGDTTRTAIVADPDASYDALILPPGGPRMWDLSGATPTAAQTNIYRAASEGVNASDFPGSDLVIIGNEGSETYFDVNATQFRALGYSGPDPGGFGLDIIAKFSPIVVERYAPLNFFDTQFDETNLNLAFSTDALPDSLFEGIPISIDSIRVRINTQRNAVCDGYGTVKLPSGAQHEVLRLRRTEFTTTNLDVKVPFLGWVDISTLLGGGGGGGLSDFLGVDTTITHRFYTNNLPQEVAVLSLTPDGSEIEQIRYLTGPTSSTDDDDAPGKAGITAFPNPAVDWVRFDCTNLPPDEYTIKMYNILGKPVWQATYPMSGNKSIRLDLNSFKKGTYLYSLVNKRGQSLGTRRLVIVKP